MQVIFEDKDLEELVATGYNHKYRKYARDKKFLDRLKWIFTTMRGVTNCSELRLYSYLDYEKMKYEDNQYSVKVMKHHIERIIFRKIKGGIIIEIIKLDDTHYGDEK